MRVNHFLAKYTDLSRRAADKAIQSGRVEVNGELARVGDIVITSDKVSLDRKIIKPEIEIQTIKLNKPVGYVCSKTGQGSLTVYDLLPFKYHSLNPVGRLDKNSSGLLLLTNDGELANKLTHPKYEKNKIYRLRLDKQLQLADKILISEKGVSLDDGNSRLGLTLLSRDGRDWQVVMKEGRNRQIRRTFKALGYKIITLHRTHFGPYKLDDLESGNFSVIMS
jgi:23S rRNA pseudouridine2605 synthase